MPELIAAIGDGRVQECFTCGTAVTMATVKDILYKGIGIRSDFINYINCDRT